MASTSKNNPLYYENLWRPAYEYYAAAAWITAAMGTYLIGTTNPSLGIHIWISSALLAVGIKRGLESVNLIRRQINLRSNNINFLPATKLTSHIDTKPREVYLGTGFRWGTEHAQRAYQIRAMSSELDEISLPWPMNKVADKRTEKGRKLGGVPWIHGLDMESAIYQHTDSLAGHTVIFGTTGSGKTRLMELVTAQAIHRGDTVICIDPKGDRDWENRLKIELKKLGREKDFYKFSPAHPSESVRLDPMINFTKPQELASRITALIQSDTGNDPFVAFSWKVLNQIIKAMIAGGERPTLHLVKQYLEIGTEGLLEKIIEKHFDQYLGLEWRSSMESRIRELGKSNRLAGLNKLYRELAERGDIPRSEAVDGLYTLVEHSQEHMGKMIASLLPIMEMLTSGPLKELLSPSLNDMDDPRPLINTSKIIRSGKVLYVALDSLSDPTVGSAIGSILLADITACAGARYNYGDGKERTVSIFVDEASEVVNRPFISLLNKGRGANFQCTFASQTMPDFIARTGSDANARQILGNANNLISLRVTDTVTQEYCVESFGKTTIKSTMQTTSASATSGSEVANWSGGYGERLIETEADMFPASLLSVLPNLQYVARLADGRIVKGKLPILTDK